MDLLGAPAAEVVAAMKQDLQQADDPGVVDFDSRIAHRAHGDGQRDALEQGEVDRSIVARQHLEESRTGPAVSTDSLLERRGFEPPVLFGLFRLGKGVEVRPFSTRICRQIARRTIL